MPLAALTYASIGQLETRNRLRDVPLAMRAPTALFGSEPPEALPAGSRPLAAGLGAWQ